MLALDDGVTNDALGPPCLLQGFSSSMRRSCGVLSVLTDLSIQAVAMYKSKELTGFENIAKPQPFFFHFRCWRVQGCPQVRLKVGLISRRHTSQHFLFRWEKGPRGVEWFLIRVVANVVHHQIGQITHSVPSVAPTMHIWPHVYKEPVDKSVEKGALRWKPDVRIFFLEGRNESLRLGSIPDVKVDLRLANDQDVVRNLPVARYPGRIGPFKLYRVRHCAGHWLEILHANKFDRSLVSDTKFWELFQ